MKQQNYSRVIIYKILGRSGENGSWTFENKTLNIKLFKNKKKYIFFFKYKMYFSVF